MSATDLKIKCEIRSLLVQLWIDTNKVNISSHRGVVFIRGTMERVSKERSLSSTSAQIDEKSMALILHNLEERIRRVNDVKRVFFDLDNFKKTGVNWQRAQ
jgi:hypothetical protein